MSGAEVLHAHLPATPVQERWRVFWMKNKESNSGSCERAKNLLNDSDFRKKINKRLTEEQREYLEDVDEERLGNLVTACLDDADGQRMKHHTNKKLINRVGKRTVVFAHNFSGFLQAYSGIVEIMKGIDSQYGGLAYTTLSLLLVVAVNKQNKEEHIDATLLTLQREFSRMKVLEEIHSTGAMKTYIADAYRLGIEFSRVATLYYSTRTYRRVLEAVTKPPKLDIDLMTLAITEAMTQIERERDTLDSRRLYDIQRDVIEVRGSVEAVHVQKEGEILGVLKAKLLQDDYDSDKVLEVYSSMINDAFKNLPRVSPLRMDQLMQEESFRHWESQRRSCMMLLHGRTATNRTDFSWLSPAVLHLIKWFRGKIQMVAFHCCQDELFMDQDIPAHVVISSIIYQLLEANVSLLRNQSRYQAFSKKISDPAWCATAPTLPFAVLGELLSENSNACILLDRIDRIKGDPDRFMESLVRLVKDSRCSIKILLVASSNGYEIPEGKMRPDLLESIEYELGGQRFVSLLLNQK